MAAAPDNSVEASGITAGQLSIALHWASLAMGAFLGLALLKFGNPVVLDHMVEAPGDWIGLVFQPWPGKWGHGIFVGLLFLVCAWMRGNWIRPSGLAWVPLAWLGIQYVAGAFTLHAGLTKATLVHFSIATGCFYLGYCFLKGREFWPSLTLPILGAFGWVIWMGMDQHFGGLAATRAEFYKQNPDLSKFPAEFIKKINSDRIFSTLVYPNALAGAILLFLAPLTFFIWDLLRFRRKFLAILGVLALITGGFACLVWSGSKAGWLVALVLMAVSAWQLKFSTRIKYAAVILLLLVGAVAFGIRYRDYFSRGATSVGARFDYWKAGIQNFSTHPWTGSGPGTFAVVYAKLKAPDSEMARLAHNDYLQQGSDSGILGLVAYLGIFPVMLWKLRNKFGVEDGAFWWWIGLLGWGIQSAVEFGLYIPALSWAAFFWMGWLLGTSAGAERLVVKGSTP